MVKPSVERVDKWDRKLWGVELTCKDVVYLIGGAWHPDLDEERYEGEPVRVLLFKTRKLARKWCVEQNLEHKQSGRTCKRHFKPVKVREETYIYD